MRAAKSLYVSCESNISMIDKVEEIIIPLSNYRPVS